MNSIEEIGAHTKFDRSRAERCGLPEVVYAKSKTVQQVLEILEAAIEKEEPLLVTKASEEQCLASRGRFSNLTDSFLVNLASGVISYKSFAQGSGTLAVVTAGTSENSLAEEIKACADFFGFETRMFLDVGVASLQRLTAVLPEIRETDIIIASAGMEAALVSVLGGLVKQGIIAVPSSVGYGASFDGLTALLGMLNSCSPGVTVVNIDNGFGAVAAAYKFLNTRGSD